MGGNPMRALLRWIGSLLGLGSDTRAQASYDEMLYEIRHRNARYY
jgi:hypothetical protein